MPQMCAAAWMRLHTPLRQVIIAGPASHAATQALLDAAHAAWAPDKAVLLIDPTNASSASFWQQHSPEAWAMVDAHYRKAAAAAAAPAGPAEAPASSDAAAPAAVEAPPEVDVQELGLEAAGVASSADAASAPAGASKATGTTAATAAEGPAGEVRTSEVAAAGGAGSAAGFVPTAFVCQNFTCLAPTSSADKLYEQLSVRAGKAAAGGVKLTPVKL
eukprot:GHRQ01011665.1.p1 GENE.GHRQ01011665.1~~GHRQ01011665.1.p1  ORF type:complete len:255 (+),score=110.24 GHRQ01011665.1:116-766(+)